MFLTFVLLFIAMTIIIGWSISAPRYRGPVSDHFDGRQFFNPSGHNAKGLGAVLKWQTSKRGKTPWSTTQEFELGEKPTAQITSKTEEGDSRRKIGTSSSVSEPNLSDLRVTFVGHSTVLLQFDGWNVLTDPVWYERCSPFQWAGPKRVVPAGIRLEDLPPIDLILQSHNHWDHLDIENLKKIYQKYQPQIVTSLGISPFLKQHGVEKCVDLDWNDTFLVKKAIYTEELVPIFLRESSFPELTVTCLPAQHFSARGMFDRNATLWSSFMVSSPNSGNIYFGGDSGYASFFKEIGAQFGRIRLALIPIGAFKPEWFMSVVHCSPSKAVQIHLDINAEKTLAIHHGTFPLADDGRFEPVEELEKALKQRDISEDDFFVLKEGAFRDL